jgi:hypothetical protein
MYFALVIFIENNVFVNKDTAKELRDYVLQYYPLGKVTWAFQPAVLESIAEEFENYIAECVSEYGDDIGIGTGFPCIDWTDSEAVGFCTGVIDLVISKFGVTPVFAGAYGWRSTQLQLLHDSLGIDVVMGTAWSQEHVDRYSGAGSIPYPYYTSKTHNLIPAQSENDKVGTLTLDTNTPDLVGNMFPGVRFTIHPADPTGYIGNNALHVTNQYVSSGLNDFVLLTQYLEILWLQTATQLKTNWKDYIDKLYTAYPTLDFVTVREFNTWFRTQYNDTPTYKFEFTGSGNQQVDHLGVTRTSDSNIKNRWLFSKDGRCCVSQNLTTLEYNILDTLSYKGGVQEPITKCDYFSLVSGLNWKMSQSPTSKQQWLVKRWQDYFDIEVITKKRMRGII